MNRKRLKKREYVKNVSKMYQKQIKVENQINEMSKDES